MFSRRECERDTGQDHQAAYYLSKRQFRSQPQPFHERGQRRGKAEREHHGQARAESWQRLKECHVANAEPDAPADEKNGEGVSRQSTAECMAVNCEKSRRETEAPEIRFG